uniref:Albumin domain-containing protein n=1 Tax=Latimeria chalumnae TaxID=7897 RepID=H3A4E6_LATCH
MKTVSYTCMYNIVSPCRIYQGLFKKAEKKSKPCEHLNVLGEERFKGVILVNLAQNLPNSTYGELVALVRQIIVLANKCCSDTTDPECLKEEIDIFENKICAEQGILDKHKGLSDCCSKAGHERDECFLKHRKESPRDFPPIPKLENEERCKKFQEDKLTFMGQYVYEVARRQCELPSQVALLIGIKYEKMFEDCCKAEKPSDCIDAKEPVIKDAFHDYVVELKSICQITKKFGTRVIQAKKLVEYSQKLPQVSFSEVFQMIQKITAVNKLCCEGDMMKCVLKRKELIENVCSNQESIKRTKHLAECCNRPLVERGLCITTMEPDEKPKDLSERIGEFIEDQQICKNFTEGQDLFLGRFLYEYARRHPELSTQLILRIGKGYEELLTKCCQTDNPYQCYSNAIDEVTLKKGIQEDKELFKSRCDILKKDGIEHLQQILLIDYTKKIPQAAPEVLFELSKQLTAVGVKCCKKDHPMPCTEEYISKIIGMVCENEDLSHLSPNVIHCCNESYSSRRPCFTNMKTDTSYMPPEFSVDAFIFHADVCTASPEEISKRKSYFLTKLVKWKPTINDEQLKKTIKVFEDLKDQCCKTDDPGNCFQNKCPKLPVVWTWVYI